MRAPASGPSAQRSPCVTLPEPAGRRNEDEGTRPARIGEADLDRDLAAERVADDDGLVDPERAPEAPDHAGVEVDRVRRVRLGRAPVPRQIRCDDPPAAREGRDRVLPVGVGRRDAVEEDERRPGARLAHVQADAVDVDVPGRDDVARHAWRMATV